MSPRSRQQPQQEQPQQEQPQQEQPQPEQSPPEVNPQPDPEPTNIATERPVPDGQGGFFLVSDGVVRNDSSPGTEVVDGTEPIRGARLHPNPDGGHFIITG